MKSKLSFNLLVGALALVCLVGTGCRKKPVGVTNLPGSRTGNVAGANPGNIFGDNPQGGLQSGNLGGFGGEPMAQGGGHAGWREDAGMFASETVYFDYDSSAIKEGEKQKIENVANYYKGNTSGSVALKVAGHCDERGTEEYNRSLGERRALAIREYIIRTGVSAERVDTVSFGEDKPAVPGHDESAWRQNRRGEFIVLTAP